MSRIESSHAAHAHHVHHAAATPMTTPTVTVTTSPKRPAAGEPATLLFEIRSGGARLTEFDVVHEKLLHLIMITPDLGWFAHEHPTLRPDGRFALDFTFAQGGEYRLFADFKPVGEPGIVVPVDIEIAGPTMGRVALVPTELAVPRRAGRYEVTMISPSPTTGGASPLSFVVTKDGARVRDLEPYLGALGHLVILGEDAKTFLHSHPLESPADIEGEVGFIGHFDKPGLYKAWAQFLRDGENITADFVLDVRAPSRPSVGVDAHAHRVQHA